MQRDLGQTSDYVVLQRPSDDMTQEWGHVVQSDVGTFVHVGTVEAL